MRGLKKISAVATALALAGAALSLVGTTPAVAASRVTVTNPFGGATVDPTYTTKLTLSGKGFQSIRKGHGGIYVLFGAIQGEWRPSKGGQTGKNYLTVPDGESRENGGFAKFVAFPGSDTESSANGGTISAAGAWSTTMNVPGATFQAIDRDGKAQQVDCRKDTCGVLTVGAHGVVNPRNETFTRVRVADLYGGSQKPATTSTTGSTTTTPTTTGGTAPVTAQTPVTGGSAAAPAAVAPALDVDRASARPGRVLAFSARGLVPGSQVSATFEDGKAGVGPLTVGTTGQVAGLLRLPADLRTGTYELRLVGDGELPTIRFAVVGKAQAVEDDGLAGEQIVFIAAAGLVLLGAVAFAAVRRRGVRRAAA